jgi:hypothetical protein
LVLGRRDLQPFCHPDQIGQRLGAHFVHDAATMNFDSDLADPQLETDLLVKQAGDNQAHHFPLAGRQRIETLAQFRNFPAVLARSAVALKGLLNRFQEILIAERLGEEFRRPGFHGAHRRWDVAVTSDEDDRKFDAMRADPG